ncbi:uncharacterized protein ARMOST_18301 [Armillaria ostoyae]|uniref:Uncharacterized protein n=1 Tax=Armillaria ostoyae TaxID=47428 RepID=A0A284S1E9_ARMOS|nr:uncharacterized protein ARMOST_18301 [Armillaria ostoyae]
MSPTHIKADITPAHARRARFSPTQTKRNAWTATKKVGPRLKVLRPYKLPGLLIEHPSTRRLYALKPNSSSPTDEQANIQWLGKQGKWKDEKSLPYNLLSDPKRAFISVLGAGTTKTHFVFAKGCYDRQAFKLALDAIQEESEKDEEGDKEEEDRKD